MEIVQALAVHAGSIIGIQKRAWLHTYPNKEVGISKEDIERHFSNMGERICRTSGFLAIAEYDKSCFCLVTRSEQKIIGYCIAEKDSRQTELSCLYVEPNYQWQGYGTKLMIKVIEWAQGMNISLWVASYNKCAIQFYEKFGFSLTDNSRPFFLESICKSIPAIEMRRTVCEEYISE